MADKKDRLVLPVDPVALKKYEETLDELQRVLITFAMTRQLKPQEALEMIALLTCQLGYAKSGVNVGSMQAAMTNTMRDVTVRNRAMRVLKIALGEM